MAGIVIEYADTFTRALSASVRDYQGNYVTVPTDVRRYQGARLVDNKLIGLTGWRNEKDATVTDLGGGVTQIQTTAGSNNSRALVGEYLQGVPLIRQICSVEVRVTSSAPGENLLLWQVGGSPIDVSVDLLQGWTRITVSYVPALDSLAFFVGQSGTTSSGLTIEVREAQIELSPGGNTIPSEYVTEPTWFPYTNGNTVDANGIVTEAQGAPISGIKLLLEDGATNIAYPSEDMDTFLTIRSDGASVSGNLVSFGPLSISRAFAVSLIEVNSNNVAVKVRMRSTAGDTGVRLFAGELANTAGRSDRIELTTEFQTYTRTLDKNNTNTAVGFMNAPEGGVKTIEVDWIHVEDNSDTATSYIPTTTGPVTRNPESLTYADLPTPIQTTLNGTTYYAWDGSVPFGEYEGFCIERMDDNPTTASLSIAADATDEATITVVTRDASAYSIDWGDGNTTTGVASNASTSHTYAADTTGVVTITAASPIEEILCDGTGDVWTVQCTELPRALLEFTLLDGSVSGAAAELPSGLTMYRTPNTPVSSITGVIADLPTNLEYFDVVNAAGVILTGDVADLPRNLYWVRTLNSGVVLSGNASDIPSGITSLQTGSNNTTITPDALWSTSLDIIRITPNPGLSAAEVDAWINLMAGVTSWVPRAENLILDEDNAAPTAASATALQAIIDNGGTVATN